MEKKPPKTTRKPSEYHRLSVDLERRVFKRLEAHVDKTGQSLRFVINKAVSLHLASVEAHQ